MIHMTEQSNALIADDFIAAQRLDLSDFRGVLRVTLSATSSEFHRRSFFFEDEKSAEYRRLSYEFHDTAESLGNSVDDGGKVKIEDYPTILEALIVSRHLAAIEWEESRIRHD